MLNRACSIEEVENWNPVSGVAATKQGRSNPLKQSAPEGLVRGCKDVGSKKSKKGLSVRQPLADVTELFTAQLGKGDECPLLWDEPKVDGTTQLLGASRKVEPSYLEGHPAAKGLERPLLQGIARSNLRRMR